MSLHADLLRQARQLALKEPRRPSQASLRRAISASYYALFHLLIDEVTRRMFSGRDRAALRGCLGRAVRPRRHEESGAAVLGRWSFSQAQSRDERPSGPTGVHWSCGDVHRPSASAPRSRLRHNTPIHATRRDRLGGPCGAGISGLGHCAKSVQADVFLAGLLAFGNMRI